jgi:HSP20 family protein
MAIIPWRPKDSWWNPFHDMERIQNEMNRLFDTSLVNWEDRDTGLLERAWNPAIDVYDSKDSIIVKADIPGMKKDEIDVSVHNDTLIIRGEKKHQNQSKDKNHVRTERYYGSFNRAIRLPSDVETSRVEAFYKNGVLELLLPKREESRTRQLKIDIK